MMDKVIVYHGTYCLFDAIDLSMSKNNRDFGRGFYTTTISAQAENWARNLSLRHNAGNSYVYVFEFKIDEKLIIKQFEGLSIDWLNFIRDNRVLGEIQHDFDVVSGPVANDNTLLTVNRYITGVYTAEEALNRLKYFRANDQFSFHTEKSLQYLKLIRRYELG